MESISLDQFFKFKIGDHVRVRRPANELWQGYAPFMVVVARLLEECPGGVQRHYALQCENHTAQARILEEALELWAPQRKLTGSDSQAEEWSKLLEMMKSKALDELRKQAPEDPAT